MTACPKADEGDRREHGPALPPHPCPFAQEIHGDDSTCRCCDGCINECAMDV